MEVYVLRSKDGKYFRAKGYGGAGESWIADLKRARFYADIGPAKSQATYWGKRWPEYGAPDIVTFKLIESRVIPQNERVKDVVVKQKEDKARRDIYRKKQSLKKTEVELKELKEYYRRLEEDIKENDK